MWQYLHTEGDPYTVHTCMQYLKLSRILAPVLIKLAFYAGVNVQELGDRTIYVYRLMDKGKE